MHIFDRGVVGLGITMSRLSSPAKQSGESSPVKAVYFQGLVSLAN